MGIYHSLSHGVLPQVPQKAQGRGEHQSPTLGIVTSISCAFSLCLLWGVCAQETELLLLKPAAWDVQRHLFAPILLEDSSLQKAWAGEASWCKTYLAMGSDCSFPSQNPLEELS